MARKTDPVFRRVCVFDVSRAVGIARFESWGRRSGGVKSAGVSQSVREPGRDESQSVPSPINLFKTRDSELPLFEGSHPSCSPHSAGYTRTSVHPYFPMAKSPYPNRGRIARHNATKVGHTPSTAGTSGRNSGKIPERPWKRSQSVSWNSPREYGWDPPNTIIQGIWRLQSISRILSPQYGWGRFFFQKWFRRGPLRAGHGIPSSTGGISA